MLQKHIPLKMIDLELRVREVLYAHLLPEQLQAMSTGEMGAATQRNSVLSKSPEQLRAMSVGKELDLLHLLVSIAYDVTPRIAYPQTPGEVVIQLAELALDCPDLLTRLPVYITASPDGQHALILNVPLKSLYVNVLDRAIRFGLDELERLANLDAVPSEWARTLLWAMEKNYVEKGEKGGFWMHDVLQCLALPTTWEAEKQVREHVLAELIGLGLIKLRGSRAEIYDLTAQVKVPLVRKYRLWEKWDEYDRDEEAIALAQKASSGRLPANSSTGSEGKPQ